MLKSIYIMAYLTAAVAVTVMGVQGLLKGQPVMATAGVLLTSAPIVLFVGYMTAFSRTARTRAILLPVLALGLVGVGLAVTDYLRTGASERELIISATMLAAYFLYDLWYARLDRGGSQLRVGDDLPTFELVDDKGARQLSASFRGSPSVLIFYRGNWCPLCMAQVKEMAASYNTLKDAGVRVVFISPQPAGHTKSLAKKFEAGMEFMRDEGNQAARSLGIVQGYGTPMGMQALGYDSDTVLPTVIITNAEGRVVWLHETDNYRVRPEPETYMQVLKANRLLPT